MASFTNTQYCLRSSSGLNGRLRLFILYVLDCGDFKDDVWISPFNLRPHCKHLNNRKMVKSLHSLEESCITADMWSAVGGSELRVWLNLHPGSYFDIHVLAGPSCEGVSLRYVVFVRGSWESERCSNFCQWFYKKIVRDRYTAIKTTTSLQYTYSECISKFKRPNSAACLC